MLFHSYYAQHNWQNVTHPINHQLHFIGLSKKNRPRSIWFAIPPGTSGGAFPLKSVVTPFIGSTNVSGWWPHLRIHPGSSDFVSNGLCVSKECFQALKGFLLKKLYWCNATTWYAVYTGHCFSGYIYFLQMVFFRIFLVLDPTWNYVQGPRTFMIAEVQLESQISIRTLEGTGFHTVMPKNLFFCRSSGSTGG